MALNAQEIKGQWKELSGQVKKRWGALTDDDLRMAEGNVDSLVGKIQMRTGEAREAVENYLNDLAAKGSSMRASGMVQTAREYASQASDQLREGYGQAESAVKSNPVPAIAIAFGVGLVAGIALAPSLRLR